MQSLLRTGANLMLKVSYETGGEEKTIGFVQAISFNVIQGQKPIITVDSPFPQEFAQGAAPSMVSGSATLYVPKGSDPIRAGLVAPTFDAFSGTNTPLGPAVQMFNWRLYDRLTGEMAFAVNSVKVGSWSMNVAAKSLMMCSISFEGLYFESGPQ